MKSFFFTIGMWVVCFACPAQELTTAGKANAEIINENREKSLTLEHAGKELSLWLEKISGAALPVLEAPGNSNVKMYLGTPESSKTIAAFAKPDVMKKLRGNDGFAIDSDGKNIYIYADCPKGVLNGVYRFLEKNSDIIFVRPMQAENGFGTIYGKNPDIKSELKNIVDIPVFKLRQFRTDAPLYEGRNMCSPVLRFWNEDGAKIGASWESLSAIIRGSAEGQKKPEFFAKRNGRTPGWWTQLCFTNKGLLKYYQNQVDEAFSSSPEKLKYFNVNHSDNWDVCMCDECLKPITLPDGKIVTKDDKNFRSTQFFMFYNEIMKNLEKKHPGRQLMALSYIWSAPPPDFPISQNIVVEYAPYVKQHKLPIYDPANAPWGDWAKQWMKQHRNIMIYEYYFCTSSAIFPNPVADVAALDLRFYAKSGSVIGMMQDCPMDDSDTEVAYDRAKSDYKTSNVFDMSAMEFWVVSRLYWNPEQDTEKLRDEYCRRAYREAAVPMREFYRLIGREWNQKDKIRCDWISSPSTATINYVRRPGLADKLSTLLAEAEAKAVHPGSKELIRRQQSVFEKLLKLTEKYKTPQKITVEAPFVAKVPEDSLDFNTEAWKDALVIDDLRDNGKVVQKTIVKIIHDRHNIYMAFDLQRESEKKLEEAKNTGVKPLDFWPPPGTWVEVAIDGDLGDKGGFYKFIFNPVGNKVDFAGGVSSYNNDAWTVKVEITGKTTWKALLKIPLESIGRNISMNNIFSLMIYRRNQNETWLDGNRNDPDAFQNLVLKMN